MSKSKSRQFSKNVQKLHIVRVLQMNELCIKNNLKTAKELGLDVIIDTSNNEVLFRVTDPLKPHRNELYELRDDNLYKRILNRLYSLYK